MTCGECGGLVEYKYGPMLPMPHTQCTACGAINAHVTNDDVPTDEEEQDNEQLPES